MSARTRFAASALVVALVSGVLRAQEAQPLPDFDSLYKSVRNNLTKSETVAHLYAFKERRTDIHTNPFGRIGTGGTESSVMLSPLRPRDSASRSGPRTSKPPPPHRVQTTPPAATST